MSNDEINFDGLIGPTHNYAGLSLGNRASQKHAKGVSRPKQAALQGLQKMRLLMSLGIAQGFLPPHPRCNSQTLRHFGFAGTLENMMADAYRADPVLFANLFSASPMWTANAATVAPSADTADGKIHLSTANLATMFHRATEADFTTRILRTAFANTNYFKVHDPLIGGAHMGDEGAANHGRFCVQHDKPGVQLFVYGDNPTGKFPARQSLRASHAIARRHGVSSAVFLQQSNIAIEAGAFHNDVVSVANERVLFCHEQTFEHRAAAHQELRAAFPDIEIIEVMEADVPLADAIQSYLFNSQLVTLPDGVMTLILPIETQETPSVKKYLDGLVARQGVIKSLNIIDVRESMRNGGGPACLRLRVAVAPQEMVAIDPRFILDIAKVSKLEACISQYYPDEIHPEQLGDAKLHRQCLLAISELADVIGLSELYGME
jgi:succinylarginine dihydrolase